MREAAHRTTQSGRAATVAGVAIAAALAVCLALPAAALAAPPTVHAVSLNPADWLSDAVDGFKDVVLGPIKIGVDEVAGLLVSVLTALADLLVPDWLIKPATELMTWIVAVPDWGREGSTGTYVFSGVNNLHDIMRWFGVGLLAAGATWGATSSVLGSRAPEDIVRALMTAAIGLVFYRSGWGQLAAITNSITDSMMSVRDVQRGLSDMLAFTAGGTFLSVGTIFAPILVIIAAIALLGLIAAKAALILLSAIVYVTGGLVLGLLIWPGGRAIAGAWAAMAGACFLIPVLWSVLFAVSGVLMSDAMKSGGQLVEGDGAFSGLMTQIMLAVTSIVALVLAIKMAGVVWGMARSVPLGLIGGGGKGGASIPGERAAKGLIQKQTGGGQARSQLMSMGDSMASAAGLGSMGQLAGRASSALAASPLGPVASTVAGFADAGGVWGLVGGNGTATGAAASGTAGASAAASGDAAKTAVAAAAVTATGGAAALVAAGASGGAGAGAASGAVGGAAASAGAEAVTTTELGGEAAGDLPVGSLAPSGGRASTDSGQARPAVNGADLGPAAPIGDALVEAGEVPYADASGPPRPGGEDSSSAMTTLSASTILVGSNGEPGRDAAAIPAAAAAAPANAAFGRDAGDSSPAAAFGTPDGAGAPSASEPAAPSSSGRFSRDTDRRTDAPPNPARED